MSAQVLEMPQIAQSLPEKYRPARIDQFIGLDRPRKILANLAARPYPSNWIFCGPTGTGKTTMALALAEAIPAEVHHIASKDCTVAEIDRVWWHCMQYYPEHGKRFHLILVDEADLMTQTAQDSTLSKLDTTNLAPNTIWVFTCNSTESFKPRFLQRNKELQFSSYGLSSDIASFLAQVWKDEAGTSAAPNFARIVKDNANSVRGCLNDLEMELMAVN